MSEITRIESLEALDALFERSLEVPVWLFKHSLTCPISTSALAEYQAFAAGRSEGEEVELALVEIQRVREVSNAVAERTGVRHESPQAILLREKRPVWNASHWKITKAALEGGEGEPA